MNQVLDQLVRHATARNLVGASIEPAILLLLFAIFRSMGLRLLRALPSNGSFSTWSKDVEALFKRSLALAVGIAILGDLGLNLWLIWTQRDLVHTKLDFLGDIYTQHRGAILLYVGVSAVAVVINLLLLQIVSKLLAALTRWAQNVDRIKGNDDAIAASFELLWQGVERASWIYLIALGAGKVPFLPGGISAALYVGLRVLIVYTISRVIWSSLEIIVTTLDGLAKLAAEKREKLHYYEVLKPLFPSLRRALEATILVVGTSFAVAQVQAFATLSGLGLVGLKVVGLLFAAQAISTIFEFVLRELFVQKGTKDAEERQRRLTVVPLVASIAKYVIFGFSIVMSLTQLGIDPMPVLAGAGVAGVAIGFGAQSLITDLVSGIFILWENYFIVGDYVAIGGREGFVEAISLRVTSLRDEEGRVHIIPNGKIEGIVNYSKGYVSAEIGVGVSYDMNLDDVYAALEEVSDWVVKNVPDALEAPEIEGVDAFADSAVTVKLSTKVKPGTHLTTGRIIRKRIKEVFDRRGIEIAYPRRVLYLRSDGGREIAGDLGDVLRGEKAAAKKEAAR